MLTNSISFFILLIICYSALIFAKKFFGKAGIFSWIAVASIISNILAASTGPMIIPIENFTATFANITFATILVANNILTKDYGIEQGKKGVGITLCSSIIFPVIMGIAVTLEDPDIIEIASAQSYLFSITGNYVANSIASVLMLFLANLANIYIFSWLDKNLKKTPAANMFANMFCNCVENFGFVLLGLYLLPKIFVAFGSSNCEVFPIETSLMIALSTCVFEILISFTTPILVKITDKIQCKDM